MNNIKSINNRKNISSIKTGKKEQMMRKPLPFNMNFWKKDKIESSLPNCDQNREMLINKYHQSPIVLNRPFKKEVIRFHNKKKLEPNNNNDNQVKNFFTYLKKNPLDDGSYDLHKANWM